MGRWWVRGLDPENECVKEISISHEFKVQILLKLHAIGDLTRTDIEACTDLVPS